MDAQIPSNALKGKETYERVFNKVEKGSAGRDYKRSTTYEGERKSARMRGGRGMSIPVSKAGSLSALIVKGSWSRELEAGRSIRKEGSTLR